MMPVVASGRQAYWEHIYGAKGENEVSWFQPTPEPSLDLIALTGATADSAIIDIGGGASRLVDELLASGFGDLTVLDLSMSALAAAQARLGAQASRVHWLAADATTWTPLRRYDVWHDRATFHFLTGADEQAAYLERLRRALRPGGYVIFGTFALDGPEKCSGLPVARYDAESLAAMLGDEFWLVDTRRHEHTTPMGATQRFQFSTFRHLG